MAQSLASAQLMPARMPRSEPEPLSLSTFPAKISASVATPYRRVPSGSADPQAVPMQCVPWPWASCTVSPRMKDCVVTERPMKSVVLDVEAGVQHRDPDPSTGSR